MSDINDLTVSDSFIDLRRRKFIFQNFSRGMAGLGAIKLFRVLLPFSTFISLDSARAQLIPHGLWRRRVTTTTSTTTTTTTTIPPVYILSQSTAYPSCANTLASLKDSSSMTGAGTSSGTGEWIQLTASVPVTTSSVTLMHMEPGAPGGWGAGYINNTVYQYHNGSSWVTLAIISGFSDGGSSITFSHGSVTATQFRVYRSGSGYLGVGEFIVN